MTNLCKFENDTSQHTNTSADRLVFLKKEARYHRNSPEFTNIASTYVKRGAFIYSWMRRIFTFCKHSHKNRKYSCQVANDYEYVFLVLHTYSQTITIKLTFVSIRSHSQIDWGIRKHSKVSTVPWRFGGIHIELKAPRCKMYSWNSLDLYKISELT